MKIFLDIETVPLGEEPKYVYEEFSGVKVPANYKNPALIEEYKKEHREKQFADHINEQDKKRDELLHEWKKGALKATRSQIVCICAVTDDGFRFSECGLNESEILWKFEKWIGRATIGKPELVGHNISSFDIPLIRSHACKFWHTELKRIFTFEKFSKSIHDTMILWDSKNWTKLTEIAEFLGIKNLNGDTDGSDIYDLYKAGKFDEIETKCMNDVLMCKEVYERIC